jgi:hypothetical protein
LKHIISFSHTVLRNSPSANFLIIPPDKNVFYRKYECDIFDVLQEEIELYSVDGNVAVIGDLNGRVGKEPDFLNKGA